MKQFALAALLLGGCATIYDLEQRPPDGRYVSTKSIGMLTDCISGGIRSLGQYRVERGEGVNYVTLLTQTNHPAARITVRATSTGSTVAVRQTISYSIAPVVQRCL